MDNKKLFGIVILITFLVLTMPTLAKDNNRQEISLNEIHFTPNKGLSVAAQDEIKSLPSSEQIHLLVQFENDLSEQENYELEEEGVKL